MWDVSDWVHPTTINPNMPYSIRKILLFLFLFVATTIYGGERYSVRVLDRGNMYFFMPCKIKGESGCRLQFDMTLISFRDSVSINMTLTAPLGRVKSITLQNGIDTYTTTQYELYFQERKGSRFNTRIHIDCPLNSYRQIFTDNRPLTLSITMTDGKQYTFTYKEKEWHKEIVYISEVLEMIAYAKSRKP